MEDSIELIVTSIKELTKKRRLVYINYEPAFAVYTAELRKFGIKDGESVRKELYDSLIDDVLSKRATVRAMALLKNKDYTRKGLEDKLRDGYYPDKCVEHAIEYVSQFGYINDDRFAENYVNFKAGVLTSQFLYINVCLDWAATTEFNITEKSPLVGFFIPAGTSIPEHTSLCC